MYIPPYYMKKEWKRFLAGLVLGAVAGYLFFVFIHGQLQERYTEENIQLTSKLNDLEERYEVLLNSKQQEKKSKSSTVKDISVSYTNSKELQIDKLTQHQLTSLVKEQLQSLPGKEVDIVAGQTDMIIAAIENKSYRVDDFTYELKIEQLIVTEAVMLSIEVNIKH